MTAENHSLMYQGTARHDADVTVTGSATSLLAANTERRGFVIQNVHASVSIRLTIDGVDPTSSLGLVLAPGASFGQDSPGCSKAAIKGLRIGGTSGTVAVLEMV